MVHFVVALACEARPLIAHYRMKVISSTDAFRMYAGEQAALVVSGVGKIASASATAYRYGTAGDPGDRKGAWLNVGVGGHGTCDVGLGVLAHKVTDSATGRSWYPPFVFGVPCRTAPLLTVDSPTVEYEKEWIYDMEGAGFYAAASRFQTAELIHCYKIVSDNRALPAKKLTPEFVGRLVEDRLENIDAIVGRLSALAKELEVLESVPSELPMFLDRWHFSVTERRGLERLLRRLNTLVPGSSAWTPDLDGLKQGQDVLAHLERRIAGIPVRL